MWLAPESRKFSACPFGRYGEESESRMRVLSPPHGQVGRGVPQKELIRSPAAAIVLQHTQLKFHRDISFPSCIERIQEQQKETERVTKTWTKKVYII